MSPFIYYLAGGLPFFLGAAMIVVAAFTDGTAKGRKRAAQTMGLLGGLLIVVSATPLPLWFYLAWMVFAAGWLFGPLPSTWKKSLRFITVLVSCLGVEWEAFQQVFSALPASPERRLIVVGDSVSAGAGEKNIVCWPKLFAEAHRVEVRDHSFAGANVTSALKQADAAGDAAGVVLLEIGGNDVLGFTTPAEFERGLDALLQRLRRPDRQLVMFELPLPPLYNAFGESQRRLSRRYGVQMIPKREFLGVLASPGATSDGIHLTQAGQRRMADCVWRYVGDAF